MRIFFLFSRMSIASCIEFVFNAVFVWLILSDKLLKCASRNNLMHFIIVVTTVQIVGFCLLLFSSITMVRENEEKKTLFCTKCVISIFSCFFFQLVGFIPLSLVFTLVHLCSQFHIPYGALDALPHSFAYGMLFIVPPITFRLIFNK